MELELPFRAEISTDKMTKALIVLSCYNKPFYPDGSKTGVFASEALHPYQVFAKKGVEVDFVSETGTFGWDEHSLTPDFLEAKDKEVLDDSTSGFSKAVKKIKKASEVNSKQYNIIFAAGGHGAAYDLGRDTEVHKLAAQIYADGGVVAAVCHGPVIFDGLKKLDGEILIKGRKLTGFTDEGESIMKVDKLMQEKGMKTVKQVANSNGGLYVQPKDPWESFVVVDGKIVTGVNPASATETATKTLAALGH